MRCGLVIATLSAALGVAGQVVASEKPRLRADCVGTKCSSAESRDGGQHGIAVAKGCLSPMCDGEATMCEIAFGYNDDFGDTIRIHAAWDVQDFAGDDVRIPALGAEVSGDTFGNGGMIGDDDGVCEANEVCLGNLPIVSAVGNTTCVVGGSLPCNIGPSGSVFSGLPGDPQPGLVTFLQEEYVVLPDDPNRLLDQASIQWEDLCDDPDTVGCGFGVLNIAQAPGATNVTRCDDGDACTSDTCLEGVCDNTPVVCDDGNACTTEGCNPTNGQCETSETVDCDDGDACTIEACNIQTGECMTLSMVDCDDGDACTTEICNIQNGECVTLDIVNCDDGDACTTESCDPSTGLCETTDIVDCDDNDACTTELCNMETGACETTDVVDCDDGDACTVDRCNPDNGLCELVSTVTCDDGIACTNDSCDSVTGGCVFAAHDDKCNDDDPCTRDRCSGSGCRYTNICGACCSTTGTCMDGLFSSECAGSFGGSGSECAGDADFNGLDDLCQPSKVPAVSDWGVAILSLLLLVGISLKFSRPSSHATSD